MRYSNPRLMPPRSIKRDRHSKVRFDALAVYTRGPSAELLAEELEWYAHDSVSVIGVLFRDAIDNDFNWIVMAPDAKNRYRWIDGESSYDAPEVARIGCRTDAPSEPAYS